MSFIKGPTPKNPNSIVIGKAQLRLGKSLPHIGIATPVFTAADTMGGLGSTKFNVTAEFYEYLAGFPENTYLKIPTKVTGSWECTLDEQRPKNWALLTGKDPFNDVTAKVIVPVDAVKSAAGTVSGASITVDNDGGVVSDTFIVHFTGAAAGSIYGIKTGKIHTFTALTSAMAPVNTDAGTDKYFTIPADFFTGTWADGDQFTFQTTAFVSGTDLYDDDFAATIGIGAIKTPPVFRLEAWQEFPDGEHEFLMVNPRVQPEMTVDADFTNSAHITPTIKFNFLPAHSGINGGNAVWDTQPFGVMLWRTIGV